MSTAQSSVIDEFLSRKPSSVRDDSDGPVSNAELGKFENTSAGISLASALIAATILVGLLGILSFTWDHYSVWMEGICAEKGGQP